MRRQVHIRGCPKLAHTPDSWSAVCTCPARVYKPKRVPVSKAWDASTSSVSHHLGVPAGAGAVGAYVQPIRKNRDE